MYVRMVNQVTSPGMQDANQPDLPAKMTRMLSQFLCSLRRSLKEQGIQHFLVAANQHTQFGWQCECQKKILDRQQQFPLHFQPVLGLRMLALGAMPIAAGVITVLKLLASRTAIDLSAQCFGTAVLNSPHGLVVAG